MATAQAQHLQLQTQLNPASQQAGTVQPAGPSQVIQEQLFLGANAAFWIQTGVLFFSAILAIVAIFSARANERRKSAANVLFTSRGDKEMVESIRRIEALHNGNENIRRLAADGLTEEQQSDAQRIRHVLNHYEYISVGIQQGIYDETIFKDSQYGIVVGLYRHTKPFIDALRENKKKPTIFQEFEWLACRWLSKPLGKKKLKVPVNVGA
jgi:hypothetical protein